MLQTWMNVEDIRLSERSQLQKKKKKKNTVLFHLCELFKYIYLILPRGYIYCFYREEWKRGQRERNNDVREKYPGTELTT